MNPYKIIKQYNNHPDKNNLDGKKSLVGDLVEFMTEKQLDNIIDGMTSRYDPKKLEGGKGEND